MALDLHQTLEALYAQGSRDAHIANDPVASVHRYTSPDDQELAGLIASGLAFGKVRLLQPVVDGVLDVLDRHGGPRACVSAFDPVLHGPAIAPLSYRWTRGSDLVLYLRVLRSVLEQHGHIGALFEVREGEVDVAPALERALHHLRAEAVALAGVPTFDQLPRGLRHLLPSATSTCKRWHMYLRWMVRPPCEGVDLGAWTHLSPTHLLIPLDVHVSRIARLIGLTSRKSADLRTVRQVTSALRELDPDDPVRFDFALAHLGISEGCTGEYAAATCDPCPLRDVCQAPTKI